MERKVTPVTWALAPDWLTVSEAAHLSGFDRELLQFLIEDGGIDAERTGGQWLIEKRSLREYEEALALVANWRD